MYIESQNPSQYDHNESATVRVPSLEEEKHILQQLNPNRKWSDKEIKELEKEREECKVFLVEYGSKQLLVYCNVEFTTVIANNGQKKIINDTTMVYKKARELMQREANTRGENTKYSIITSDKKMSMWAKNNGKEIFHWNKIFEPNPDNKNFGDYYEFTTTIKPEKT